MIVLSRQIMTSSTGLFRQILASLTGLYCQFLFVWQVPVEQFVLWGEPTAAGPFMEIIICLDPWTQRNELFYGINDIKISSLTKIHSTRESFEGSSYFDETHGSMIPSNNSSFCQWSHYLTKHSCQQSKYLMGLSHSS